MDKLRYSVTQAQEALDRHLLELDTTLEELAGYAETDSFPSTRHRLVYLLADDLKMLPPVLTQ